MVPFLILYYFLAQVCAGDEKPFSKKISVGQSRGWSATYSTCNQPIQGCCVNQISSKKPQSEAGYLDLLRLVRIRVSISRMQVIQNFNLRKRCSSAKCR